MIEIPWVDQDLASKITQLKLGSRKVARAELFADVTESLYKEESDIKGRPLTMEEEDIISDKAKRLVPGGFEIFCEWEILNNITQFELEGFGAQNDNKNRLL